MKNDVRTVLITGANKGLGRKAAEYIATLGHDDIVIAGRNEVEMQELASELLSRNKAKVKLLSLDLASLQSIRAAAKTFKELVRTGETGPLSTVVMNAGTQSASKTAEYSKDGFELTFATNCLGPFLLLNLLLDEVQEGGRVVWTASGTHDPDTMDGKVVGKASTANAESLAHTGLHGDALPAGVRYTTSKLCVILYSHELDRLLRESGRRVASIAFDPGYVPETALTRASSPLLQSISKSSMFKWIFRMFGGTLGDLGFSGAGLGRVAVDSEYAQASGKYIQSKDLKLHETRSSRASYDAQSAVNLWRDSARMVGLTASEAPSAIAVAF